MNSLRNILKVGSGIYIIQTQTIIPEILEKIIITGGTGFIGRNLVRTLLNNKNYSIVVIANASNFSGTSLSENTQLTFYTKDIRDKEVISKIFLDERADICIHLAAKISVADSIKMPEETMDINVKGTLNVLDACYDSDTNNFIFASSAAVYGDAKELPILEDRSLKPLSPYGTSKMLAEQHILSYKRLGKIKNAISLRIFNVYGSDQTSESDVITRFAKRLTSRQSPEIKGDGTQTRDFISVDDVVEAIVSCLTVMQRGKEFANLPPVFNIGTGKPTSVKELALKMIEIFGLDLQPIHVEGKVDEKEIKFSYADITKARENLRFIAKKSIETGLRELIESILLRKNNPH